MHFSTPDASADNPFTYRLLNPAGQVVQRVSAPVAGPDGTPVNDVTLVATNPAAGRWEIDVELNLTTSGKEFTQTVAGSVAYDQVAAVSAASVSASGVTPSND